MDTMRGRNSGGIPLAGASMVGTPFKCHISDYMRTVVYDIPGRFITDPGFAPTVICDEPNFRATLVTNPIEFLRDQDLFGQIQLDPNFDATLTEKCSSPDDPFGKAVRVVIQLSQDLGSFPAVEGQCVKTQAEGRDLLLLVNCAEPYMPSVDERTQCIHAVLVAVRAEFSITDGMTTLFDSCCYRTDDGECVYPLQIQMSVRARADSPLTSGEAITKAEACRDLIGNIRASVSNENRHIAQAKQRRKFGRRLSELVSALQLEPSIDHSYLLLWYLRLSDRVEKFAENRHPTGGWKEIYRLNDEIAHRGDIAHRGIEAIDWNMVRSIQQKAITMIKKHI